MDKGLLRSAQNVIRQRKQRIKTSKRWESLIEELGIGRLQKGYIHFSYADIDHLQAECDRKIGCSILDLDLSIPDRMSMSGQSHNEKLAKGGVFEVMLTVARDQQPLPVKCNESIITPEGLVVSLMPDKLDISKITSLLIIENGAAFLHWSEIIPLLPEKCRDSLLIYRGHGTNLNYLQKLLTQIATRTPIFVFFDFDAAGFDMCQNLNNLHPIQILVPDCWHEIHKLPVDVLKRINKPKVFIKQRGILNRLLTKRSSSIEKFISYLHHHKLAITQEHIIQNKWSLTLID